MGARGRERKVARQKAIPTEKAQVTHRLSLKKKLAIGLGSALLVFVVIFCVAPVKTVSYTVTEKYSAAETYYVKEPYTETETYYEEEPFATYETYTEREPYERPIPIDYEINYEGFFSNYYSESKAFTNAWVSIRNTDTEGGAFSVEFHLALKDGGEALVHGSAHVKAGTSETLEISYNGEFVDSFSFVVTPPTKTITEYREVEKTKEVTEYRTVTKRRDVVKYKDVPRQRTVWKERPVARSKKVTLLQYFLHY